MTKQLLKISFFTAGLYMLSFLGAYAQAPVNDEACSAIVITPNSDGLSCPPEGNDYTTEGATNSSGAGPCGYLASGDVWFSFIATADSQRVQVSGIYPVGSTAYTNAGVAVYQSNNCTSLGTALECNTSGGPRIITLATIPGLTYYVRVWTSGGAAGFETRRFDFKLCISTPTVPPANDLCSGAIELNGGSVYESYTHNATADYASSVSCDGTLTMTSSEYPLKDVWYKVTANASGLFTVWLEDYYYRNGYGDYSIPNAGPIQMEQRNGCTGTYIPVDNANCTQPAWDVWTFDSTGYKLTVNAVAGQTYYFRVYNIDYYTPDGTDGGTYFRIWAEEPSGGEVLPVEFGKLTATLNEDRSATLTWDYYLTDNNADLEDFEIEHSTDGKRFVTIGSVQSVIGEIAYRFHDDQVAAGTNYYRIAAKGLNGDLKYSSTATIDWTLSTGISAMRISPNPVKLSDEIELYFDKGEGQVGIYDLSGKYMGTFSISKKVISMSPSAYQMQSGVYVLIYQSGDHKEAHKLVIY